DAMGQVEDARQEPLLELGPAGDGGGPGGAGEDGQHGDDPDAGQRVLAIDVRAGVLEGGEGGHDLVQLGAAARHRRSPATGCGSRHGGRYTRSGGRAPPRTFFPIVIKVRAGPDMSLQTPKGYTRRDDSGSLCSNVGYARPTAQPRVLYWTAAGSLKWRQSKRAAG